MKLPRRNYVILLLYVFNISEHVVYESKISILVKAEKFVVSHEKRRRIASPEWLDKVISLGLT